MPSLHASPEYIDSQKRRRRLFFVRGGARTRTRARFLIVVIAIILVVLPHLIGLVNLLVGNALIAFSFGEFDLQRMLFREVRVLFLGWDRGPNSLNSQWLSLSNRSVRHTTRGTRPNSAVVA